jgi:hypothetical protein
MDEGVGPGRWQDELYDLLRCNNVTPPMCRMLAIGS